MGAISKLAVKVAKSALTNVGDTSPPLGPPNAPWRVGPFKIINKKTGETVGLAKTLSGARLSVDRNDNKYGAYVHRIVGPPRTYPDAAEDVVKDTVETVAEARGGRVSPFKVKR
jgi:hypothetical protein